MRLVRYLDGRGLERAGRVVGSGIRPLWARSFAEVLAAPSVAVDADEPPVELSDVRLLPPIAPDAKVFCVGYNYAEHGAEMARSAPSGTDHPMLFLRYPDSLVGAGQPVVRPDESAELDWEGEVGVVIGRPGRRIQRSDAAQHVAGFTAIADNSIRDWQFHTTQATAGKNWVASGSCGPWVQTVDNLDATWTFVTRVNGDVVQRGSTSDLVFDIPSLIAYLSTFTELRSGDLIATGTPSGIGYRATPPRFLRHGDLLEVDIEGLGVLANPVIDEATL